ncbi:hypothetical protein R1sor_013038 [Riccia sorocarpa]|uniref:Uncharacterized protein n=1 Tax=Riccia sorocarpa TaxID=122646 RepID=A0ABD3H880_9MARC
MAGPATFAGNVAAEAAWTFRPETVLDVPACVAAFAVVGSGTLTGVAVQFGVKVLDVPAGSLSLGLSCNRMGRLVQVQNVDVLVQISLLVASSPPCHVYGYRFA